VTLIDAVALALALLTGALIGTFYFGTLWLVVRRLDRLAWPAVWLGVTGILRLALVLALFALLVGTRWERLAAALVGFVAVRVVLTRWLGQPVAADGRPRRRMASGGGT
jgi:F1F0 ATPase subunit 2